MTTLSYAQLEAVWIQAGGSKSMAPLMAAIALAESSGNPDATNPTDNGGTQTSWGLWQISNGDHSEPAPNWNDPVENAKLALGKINSQGLSAWGTYDSGAYRQYLQGNVPPDSSGIPSGGNTGNDSSSSAGTSSTVALPADFLGAGPFSWLGSLVGGLAAQGGTLGGLATFLGGIGGFVSNLDNDLKTFLKALLWIINPANWVRIISGAVGTVAFIVGLVFVAKAA